VAIAFVGVTCASALSACASVWGFDDLATGSSTLDASTSETGGGSGSGSNSGSSSGSSSGSGSSGSSSGSSSGGSSGSNSGSSSGSSSGSEDGGANDAGAADADAACTPLEHYNGWENYTSCDPLGTDSESDAWLACQAFTVGHDASASDCEAVVMTAVCASAPASDLAVCATAGGDPNEGCWVYAGTDASRIYPYPYCAFTATWN
jgi:hypothetical protein